jgi:hypothetical protein
MTTATDHLAAPGPARLIRLPHGAALTQLALGIAAVSLAALPLLFNPAFYFRDDFQSSFMPVFLEVARLVERGELPLLTTDSWYGGNLLGEYQFAIFNPVSVASYLLIHQTFEDLAKAGAFYAILHLTILAFGSHRLLRAFGCDPAPAFLGALAISSNAWLLYWCAASWILGLVSFAWMPWALWALMRARESAIWILPAALFSALLFTAGYPYGNVALVAAAGTAMAVLVRRRERAGAARMALALALGAGLAAPALLPLIDHLQAGSRGALSIDRWRPPLEGMLSFGIPTFVDVWRDFGIQYRLIASSPMFYAAWFLPLVLVNARWPAVWREDRTRLLLLFGFAAAFLLLCFAPPYGPFRWTFRFIPYFHAALTLLCCFLLSRGQDGTERSSLRLTLAGAGVLALPVFLAIGRTPYLSELHVAGLAAVLLFALLADRIGRLGRPPRWSGWAVQLAALTGHVALLALVLTIWPENETLPRWPDLDRRGDPATAGTEDGTRHVFLFGQEQVTPTTRQSEVAFGNTALLSDLPAVNGYSPIHPSGLHRLFCFEWLSQSCPEAARRLFEREPRTGLTYAELMRVDRVSVAHGAHRALFDAHAPPGWRRVAEGRLADRFALAVERPPLPGSVSRLPPGVSLDLVSRSETAETFRFRTGPDYAGELVVFARAFYPGYRARVDGEQRPVSALQGILPAVSLPPGATGTLTLAFRPRSLDAGLALAAISLAALATIALTARRRGSRRP